MKLFKIRTLGAFALAAGLSVTASVRPADAQSEPRHGGTLIAATANDPGSLFPNFSTVFADQFANGPIYSRLVMQGSDGSLRPDLAESWEVSADGRVYTFHLRDGVKWHDGEPFTSADVKYTFEDILPEYHGQGAQVFAVVDTVETPDDNTVVVTLKEPNESFIVFVGLRARIVAKHIYDGTDVRANPANSAPIGTGPFKFVEWDRGSHLTLEKNEDYFVDGQPYLDRLIIRTIPDSNSRVIALENGDIDYLGGNELPTFAIPRLKRNPDIVVTNNGHEAGSGLLQMNVNFDRELFQDKAVRQALMMGIDRELINERVGLGLNTVSTGPIVAKMTQYYNPDVHKYPYDPAAAEALLDEAGYPKGEDGMRFGFEIMAPTGQDQWVRAAEVIVQNLQEIGIDAKLVLLDRAVVNDTVYKDRDFDAFINANSTGPTPALGVARQFVSSNIRPVAFTNGAGYRNDHIDALFAKAQAAATTEERIAAYNEMQVDVVEDAVAIWIYDVNVHSAYRNVFENLHNFSAYAPYDIGFAWWTEGTEEP